jgi:hypothetical protein
VLTAAHCFLSGNSTASQTGNSGKDLVYNPDQLRGYMISADNVVTLAERDRERGLASAIVYSRYSGTGPRNGVYFNDDLALVQLATPLPAETIEPARIATADAVEEVSTIAGYGASNADDGTVGIFNVTWPPLLNKDLTQFRFVPGADSDYKSAFCQGDSGGPVLSRRNRGCKRTDSIPEFRPRYLQGVI